MPHNKDLKRLVRARMEESGENYTQALTHLLSQVNLEPLPPAWRMTGSHASDYEAGLLPGKDYEGDRIAQLRLRHAVPEPQGFGAFVQSISATRYLGRKVRFSAMMRACEVTGWAGLWLRIDGRNGTLVLDNMQERALRGTTDWTPASIVLSVAEEARALYFGALLSRAGAVDLAQLRFEEAGDDAPETIALLPDEPQGLDFAVQEPTN